MTGIPALPHQESAPLKARLPSVNSRAGSPRPDAWVRAPKHGRRGGVQGVFRPSRSIQPLPVLLNPASDTMPYPRAPSCPTGHTPGPASSAVGTEPIRMRRCCLEVLPPLGPARPPRKGTRARRAHSVPSELVLTARTLLLGERPPLRAMGRGRSHLPGGMAGGMDSGARASAAPSCPHQVLPALPWHAAPQAQVTSEEATVSVSLVARPRPCCPHTCREM